MALKRPKIHRITLEATLPDGTPKTYTIDLKENFVLALAGDLPVIDPASRIDGAKERDALLAGKGLMGDGRGFQGH